MTALEKYNENPNYCKWCNRKIEVLGNQSISEVRKKNFCSRSCAAQFNNRLRNRSRKAVYCFSCGKEIDSRSKSLLCRDCWEDSISVANKVLNYYTGGKQYLTSKCQEIRKHARKVIEQSDKEKVCQCCKDHKFDEILEVHHIKGILQFDQSTFISNINNIDNLVWLYPNCHAMVEKGLLTL